MKGAPATAPATSQGRAWLAAGFIARVGPQLACRLLERTPRAVRAAPLAAAAWASLAPSSAASDAPLGASKASAPPLYTRDARATSAPRDRAPPGGPAARNTRHKALGAITHTQDAAAARNTKPATTAFDRL